MLMPRAIVLVNLNATHAKVHAHGIGTIGGNQDMGVTKKGLNTKIHLAVHAQRTRYGMIFESSLRVA